MKHFIFRQVLFVSLLVPTTGFSDDCVNLTGVFDNYPASSQECGMHLPQVVHIETSRDCHEIYLSSPWGGVPDGGILTFGSVLNSTVGDKEEQDSVTILAERINQTNLKITTTTSYDYQPGSSKEIIELEPTDSGNLRAKKHWGFTNDSNPPTLNFTVDCVLTRRQQNPEKPIWRK